MPKTYSLEEWNNFRPDNGADFFTLGDGESKIVRFLYNSTADYDIYASHYFYVNGKGITIECGEPDVMHPSGVCKWCAQGNKQLGRMVIPVFSESSNKVEYWTNRSANSTLVKTISAYFQQLEAQGKPVCSQRFQVTRQGTGKSTTYVALPIGSPDETTLQQFGTLKTGKELGVVKEADYQLDLQPTQPSNNGQQNPQMNNNFNQNYGGYNGQQNYSPNFGQPAQQATRRTTDVF